MKLDTVRRQVENLRREIESRKPVDLGERPDPVEWAEDVSGDKLDPWQRKVVSSTHNRQLLLCGRQVGKSFITAIKAAYETAFNPNANVIAIAPTFRQSKNLFDRIEQMLLKSRPQLKFDLHTRTVMRLSHGGMIRCMPGDKPDLIRGMTATSVVIDEAAFVRDSVMGVLMPMLATTGGDLTLLSTPCGPEGVFYNAWISDEKWERTRIESSECPRISDEFLDESRRKLGDLTFRQEYQCEFIQAAQAFFSSEMIDAAFNLEGETDTFDETTIEDLLS